MPACVLFAGPDPRYRRDVKEPRLIPDEQRAANAPQSLPGDAVSVVPPAEPPRRSPVAPWLPIAIVVGVVLVLIAVFALLSRGGDRAFTPNAGATDQPVLEVRLVPTLYPLRDPLWTIYAYVEGPLYTVFLDGSMIVGQPFTPPTMLRVPSVVDIGTDAVADVIAAAEAVGLPDITTEVDENAADPLYGTSRDVYWAFRYTDEAGNHELSVFSLDTAAEILPDEKYTTLYDLYFQLATLAYDAPALGDMPVERIEVMVGASVQADSVSGFEAAPWPLDETVTDLPEYVDGIRCTVVTDSDATSLRDLLTSLAADTPFHEGDRWHMVMTRALVPGEPGCRLAAA